MKINLSISDVNNFLHDKYGVVVMFLLISATLLLACYKVDAHWIVLLPVVITLIYDLLFRFAYPGKWANRGRDFNSTLNGIRAAIQYTSILIGFIGIMLSKFFEKELIDTIVFELNKFILLKIYMMALVAIPVFMLLFIPVTYTENEITTLNKDEQMHEPSVALKNYYFLILLLQKVLIILCVYMAFVVVNVM